MPVHATDSGSVFHCVLPFPSAVFLQQQQTVGCGIKVPQGISAVGTDTRMRGKPRAPALRAPLSSCTSWSARIIPAGLDQETIDPRELASSQGKYMLAPRAAWTGRTRSSMSSRLVWFSKQVSVCAACTPSRVQQ
jgi:hypothetical protein